ncbi:PREDICTED: uncharacterized protein LOC107337867 [Acropora digitifera]|uniref:uncharacterized protein LOC107337867 n=1 Tax=Acropora digitifera TaxID=70779 RepID=UPI00077AB459|nr:PREDICTED: uncharacterized protein LOC107337867 [Acropora digitifera]
MQCPHCGSQDLLPRFKFCPECSLPLPRAPKIPNVVDVGRKLNEGQSLAGTKAHSREGENQKKIHSTKTNESQPLTSQTPGESHNQEDPALSTDEGQDELPFTWQAGSDELKLSTKDESFINQGQEPDTGGNEAPSTSLSQVWPLPSQNLGAGNDVNEKQPINKSKGHSLPTPNQGAGRAGDQVPATNASSGQSLLRPNHGAGIDGDKIPATITSPGQSLPIPNKETDKDGEEIPARNTNKEQKKQTLKIQVTTVARVTRQASKRKQPSDVSSSTESSGRTAMKNAPSHPLEENRKSVKSQEMVGTQTKCLNFSSDAQQGGKAQFTSAINDKKSEKEQSDSHQSLLGVTSESGVTVVFHVLLVSDFKMKEENLFIRASGEELGDFHLNCVDMVAAESVKREDEDKPVFYRGRVTLSVDQANRGTSYKYLVVKTGNITWEDLSQYGYTRSIFNRVLKVPEKYIRPGATWNQFDGAIFVFGNEEGLVARLRGKVQSWWSRDKTQEYREMAVRRSLPRWKGFSVVDEEMEETTPMTATEAIEELKSAINSLSCIMLEEYGLHFPIKFSVEKVRGSAKSYVVCLFICLSRLRFWQLLS